MSTFTLGSLFDGSGGFPLAGALHGIRPVWASEIEPYPRAVTSARFPDMLHLGDVCGIDGAAVQPVDIITFGSPCQGMSIAGAREGLKDDRSILFYEAIRIIKEMRKATHGKYPRFAIWENVFGAFSSNKGRDFLAVLEAFCVAAGYPDTLPEPENKSGKLVWQRAGHIMGCGFSIAWRTFDAQYWGVPQRRRRIYLVADFAGECASEILFDPEGVRGDTAPGGAPGEETAGDATRGAGGNCRPRMAGSLCARYDSSPCVDRGQPFVAMPTIAPPLKAGNGHAGITDGIPDCVVVPDVFHSLTATNARCVESAQRPNCVAFMAGQGETAGSIAASETTAPTLRSAQSGTNRAPSVCYALQGNTIDCADTAGCNGCGWNEDTAYTLNTIDRHAVAFDARDMRTTRESGTLQAKATGGYSLNYQNPVCYERKGYGDYAEGIVPPLKASGGDQGGGSEAVLCMAHGQANAEMLENRCPTLNCNHEQPIVAAPQKKKPPARRFIVRRLIPMECTRLQGFPGWWGDIPDKKLHSDSAEYKMWGNGVALPPTEYVTRGIAKVLSREDES